jgi:hypothetical protein
MDNGGKNLPPVRMHMHNYDRVPRSAFPGAQPTQEAGDAKRLGKADQAKTKALYLEALSRHDRTEVPKKELG